MELSKEQIVANMTRYIKAANQYEFMTPELETLLGSEIITAPASTMIKYHNAFEGGLVDHILRLMDKAYKLNKSLIPEAQVDVKSLMKVAGLCQLGKSKLYIPNESQWHRDKQGKMYEFNEDTIAMRVGERSLYYALVGGIKLTEEECAAILNHDKIDDQQADNHNSKVGFIVAVANRTAIFEAKVLNEIKE
jgi:hypothetical protein